MNDKFNWTREDDLKPIKQENLVCKDCFHRSGRTDLCAIYQNVKPLRILKGGECEHYKEDK